MTSVNNLYHRGNHFMKLAIRIFAFAVIAAGAAAASLSSSAPRTIVSHQAASAGLPVPICSPGMPGCPSLTK